MSIHNPIRLALRSSSAEDQYGWYRDHVYGSYPRALKAVNVAVASRTRGLASCNKIPSAINDSVMPYTLRLYLCLFVVGFVEFVLVDWLSPLGPVVNALLAAVAAYLTILVGQRVLGKKNL